MGRYKGNARGGNAQENLLREGNVPGKVAYFERQMCATGLILGFAGDARAGSIVASIRN
jgi:hypothetical protein